MRKINLCYFLFVGVLVSCTNTYDVCEMQRNETEDMSSRMAGDGVYDVLGFGYDITEDYLGENSTRLQVIDVKALIRDNGDRFYVSIRPTTGIKPLYTTIATVTMNLIVSAAIVLLNPYVTIYISYKIPPFALSVHIPDVSTSIYVEVDSKVLLGLPFCDKAFVR